MDELKPEMKKKLEIMLAHNMTPQQHNFDKQKLDPDPRPGATINVHLWIVRLERS